MSEFSTLLAELIRTKDVNVNGLSSYCGVDRSTMYKLINGKRNPGSLEMVRKITDYLRLTPIEAREMAEAYETTRLGREVYYSRKDVLEFILNFQEIQSAPEVSVVSGEEFTFSESNANAFPLNGRMSIVAAIQNIIMREAVFPQGELCILAQPMQLEKLGIISLLSISHKELSVRHVICLNNSSSPGRSQHNYNLQCLKKIIPFYGTGCRYQPAYYYDNVSSHFNGFNFMPCIFLTTQAAVICDTKLNNGFLFQTDALLQPIRNQFHEVWNSSSPLMQSFESSLDFHLQKFPASLSANPDTYVLSFEPCFGSCLTMEMVEKYLSDDIPNRPSFLSQLSSYLQPISRGWINNYFSRNGLLQFLKTGLLYEIPPALYRPIEYADRIRLLKKYRLLAGSGRDLRLFQGALDDFPPNFHLAISAGSGYLMFVNQKGQYSYLILEEQNLLRAFYDFASSLDQSELVHSGLETDNFLNELIRNEGGSE